MKPSEILRKAADLIEPEGAWIQEEFGRDDMGYMLGSGQLEYAVCFCAEGALVRAGGFSGRNALWNSGTDRFLEQVIGDEIPDWNDRPGRTQAEVVKALRDAAALADAEGQ